MLRLSGGAGENIFPGDLVSRVSYPGRICLVNRSCDGVGMWNEEKKRRDNRVEESEIWVEGSQHF